MNGADVVRDGFGRVKGIVDVVLEDLGVEDLTVRVGSEANTICWLIWHLTRIQDDHVANVAGKEQVWMENGWSSRFDLPFDESSNGYGHSSKDVAAVTVDSVELLKDYHDAVNSQTNAFLTGLSDHDLDRVIDTSWNPPVTLGARLVSVISDNLQHAGQAAFIKGIINRQNGG